jgi:glycosyltransferase 2 family protein
LGLSALILWLVFRNINLKETFETILNTDVKWILYSGIFTMVAHWARGVRWKYMLEPVGENPSSFSTTVSVLVGYLANLAFPRAGEFARCANLNKLENTPVEKSFGAVVAERVIDLLVLLILLVVNLILEFDRLKTFFVQFMNEKFSGKVSLLPILLILAAIGILSVYLFIKFKDKILKIGLFKKIYDFVFSLWDGFSSVLRLKNPWQFIGMTVLIWFMYYMAAYILFFALPSSANLSILAGLTILVMGSFGMAAPTQGGIGTYHYLVGNIVVLYGLSLQDGILLATFLHASQTVYVIIFGIMALIYSSFVKKVKS